MERSLTIPATSDSSERISEIGTMLKTGEITIEYAEALLEEHQPGVAANKSLIAAWASELVGIRNTQVYAIRKLYDEYTIRLNVMKEARSMFEEEKWSDPEIEAVDTQIALLAGVLSRMFKILNLDIHG